MMAVDPNERVMEIVEEALRENPDVSNEELQKRAAEIDPGVGDLSPRSFNARYPLQVKRRMKQEEKEEEAEVGGGSEELRQAVRRELLNFAKDVAGAEDHGKLVDMVRNVDEYVDRIMEKA